LARAESAKWILRRQTSNSIHSLKRKNKRILLLLALVATLTFMLSSCSLIIGLRQTNPNGWTPTVIEKWWMEQQPKR